MHKYFLFTLKQLAFWLFYFIFLQAVFLLFFIYELKDVPIGHIFLSFKYGFGLNLASAAYCTVASVLIYFIAGLAKLEFEKANLIVVTVLLVCCTLIFSTDLALYNNWGTRINGKALWYLQFPGTVSASAGSMGHIKFVFGAILVSISFWFLFKTYFNKRSHLNLKPFNLSFSFLVLMGLLFLLFRGGLSGRPISKGQSYYSKYPVLNYAAINGFWNFFDIVSHYKPQGNPYHFFSKTELVKLQNQFNQNVSDSSFLTASKQPNILFIYLESWGTDVVGCLGGQPNVTPGFDLLANEGLLFTNFYSTGFRTEQGLMATLSGFPAQAQTYPMEEMDRFENYPNLIRDLRFAGYFTSYFTGGNPQFANTDVYLQSAGIDKINKDLLAKAKRKSAWGAMDEETFDWVLHSLRHQSNPFFSMMVTLTSHEWFEAPVKKIFKEKDVVASNFKNTVHYTDSCLFDFIGKAKKQKWYENTLIVVMADHACNYPFNRSMHHPERYHIPMLITGGALRKEMRGTLNSKYGGHLSIPALVCNEIKINSQKFKLSSTILNPASMAYFVYDHGVGVVSSNGLAVFDFNLNDFVRRKNKSDSLLNWGKFIMQASAQMKVDFQTMK